MSPVSTPIPPTAGLKADQAATILTGIGWTETVRHQYGKCTYITFRKCEEAPAAQPPAPGEPVQPKGAAVAPAPPPPQPKLAAPKAPPPPPTPPPTPEPPKPPTPTGKTEIYSREWWLEQGYTGHYIEWNDNQYTKRKQWVWDQPLGSKTGIPTPPPPPPAPKPPSTGTPRAPTPAPGTESEEEKKRIAAILHGGRTKAELEMQAPGVTEEAKKNILELQSKLTAVNSYTQTKDIESLYPGEQTYTAKEERILEIYGPEALAEDIAVRLKEERQKAGM